MQVYLNDSSMPRNANILVQQQNPESQYLQTEGRHLNNTKRDATIGLTIARKTCVNGFTSGSVFSTPHTINAHVNGTMEGS